MVVLSPFVVNASSDVGYVATQSLAGTRLNSSLKDTATQVNVMTPEFLQDLAITSLDDAYRYSLNTEAPNELHSIESPNNTALRGTINPGSNPNRSRNLTASNNTHDFFDTGVRIDAYNTERFTFASGPNSILFGNSGPGGTVDTTFKTASATRAGYRFEIQVDSDESLRTVVDLNQPIINKKLGVRFIQLRDRKKEWRDPAKRDEDRYFASVVATPFKQLSIRGYYENASAHEIAAVNTLMQDHITPWIAAGRPSFDNSATTGTGPQAGSFADPVAPSVFRRETTTASTYLFGNSASPVPANTQYNTVYTIGYDEVPGAFGSERSILDDSLYPTDISAAGRNNANKRNSWIRGVVANFNPIKNLYIEAGINQEQIRHRGTMMMRGRDMDLRVDQNLYLDAGQIQPVRGQFPAVAGRPDRPLIPAVNFGNNHNPRTVPNPNFGRYYMQTSDDAGAMARSNYFYRDQRRISASYDLDFREREGWMKWLGRHQIAGLYEELVRTTTSQDWGVTIVSDHAFIPPGTATEPAGSADQNLFWSQRVPVFRYYLTPGEPMDLQLPFDPMARGVQTLPNTDAAGNPIQVASFGSPYGARNAVGRTDNTQTKQASRSFVIQSSLLQDRMVLTYGRRKDDVKNYQAATSGRNVARVGPTASPDNRLLNPGYRSMEEIMNGPGGIEYTLARKDDPTTDTKGVVLHAFSWLSLAYTEGTSEEVLTQTPRNLDGTIAPGGKGKGREYGLTLRLPDNRLSVRYSYYENSMIGGRSPLVTGSENELNTTNSFRANNNLYGSNIRRDLVVLERSIMFATDPGYDGSPDNPGTHSATYTTDTLVNYPFSEKYRFFQEAVSYLRRGQNSGPAANAPDIGGAHDGLAIPSDRKVKGHEITIVGNPTNSLRLSVSASKSESAETNLLPQWWDFIMERIPVWEQYLDAPIHNSYGANLATPPATARPIRDLLAYNINMWNFIRLSEGKPNTRERKYRVIGTANYSFHEGMLKGFNAGANYSWRSAAAVGYRRTVIDDNPFIIQGVTLPGVLEVDDPSQPIYGGGLTTFDVFTGYQRKLFDGKVTWRVQLNVRNVLDEDDPMVQRVIPDGTGAIYTLPEPRTFILTNTFSF